jgi:hypothetical protein
VGLVLPRQLWTRRPFGLSLNNLMVQWQPPLAVTLHGELVPVVQTLMGPMGGWHQPSYPMVIGGGVQSAAWEQHNFGELVASQSKTATSHEKLAMVVQNVEGPVE